MRGWEEGCEDEREEEEHLFGYLGRSRFPQLENENGLHGTRLYGWRILDIHVRKNSRRTRRTLSCDV